MLLQPASSLSSYLDGILQIELVELLKSPVYRFLRTAIDLRTKEKIALPLINVRADSIARELGSIIFRQSCLPKTIPSDWGISLVSEKLYEISTLLKIQLEHAILKQT